ncbi:MAG: lipid II flippase MurJ, partial [Acidimicrobiia bacterium]|nr:lipid II flippase MurJ [Acidimicrobiia bacterium]
LIYNLGIILGGVVGAVVGDPSPESFLWGGLAGAAIGSFGVQWFGAIGSGLRFVPSVPLRHPDLSEYFRLAIPLMIGQSVVALDEYWPKLFGQLASQEAIGQLVGARQLNMVPVGLIATAAGVAAYPFLARLVAQGRYRDLRATVLRSVTSGLTVAGLAVGLVVSLAYPIVRVLYQWGRFQIADTVIVGELLIFYALSIPFWVAHQVYGRAFYAMRRLWTPVIVGTVVTAVTVPLLFWFGREAGAGGVALGSSIGIALYAVGIGTVWHRNGSSAELGALFGAISRIAVTAGVSGFTTLVVAGALGTRLGSIASLAISGLLGTLIYIGVGRLLALPGLEETIDRVRSSIRSFIGRRDMDDTTETR